MLLISDQNDLKRTKYNTAITYKSSPSFLYILYSVHTFFFVSNLLSRDDFFCLFLFFFLFYKARRGGAFEKSSNPDLLLLRQRVHEGLFVATRQQLFLLIGAGQRIAAVVGSHVESGVHWVCEIRGLETDKSKTQMITCTERKCNVIEHCAIGMKWYFKVQCVKFADLEEETAKSSDCSVFYSPLLNLLVNYGGQLTYIWVPSLPSSSLVSLSTRAIILS